MKYTTQEVFEILESSARSNQQFGFSDYDPDVFNYDYPVSYWIDDCDLLEWDELSKYYAGYFEFDYREEEWKAVMTPTREKTLEDVCSYIAKKATKTEIKPIKLFGNKCKEAAIFRHLKSKINGDSKNLKPSSLLSEYLENNYGEIMGEIFRLSPSLNLTLDYKQDDRIKNIGCDFLFFGTLALLVFHFATINYFTILCLVVLITGYGFTSKSPRKAPKKTEIVEAKSFRDLVYLIQEKSI